MRCGGCLVLPGLEAPPAGPGESLKPAAPAAAGDGRGPGVLWGAAAAALMGAVAAYAYRRRRARREREARLLAEIARLNALQRAREAAWRQAVAAARQAREAAAQAADRSRRWLGWLAVEAAVSAEGARRAAQAWQDRQGDEPPGTPTPPGWEPTPEPMPVPTPSPDPRSVPGGTPMPTRSPEEQERPASPWRFPYLNPNRPPFNGYLANLAEGERREIPLGSLGGFVQWGISVARGLAWPPQAPISAQGEGLTGDVGPAGISYPPADVRLRVPSRTVSVPGGGSVTLGGQLYGRFEWHGLNSVSTLGYETTWRVSLPAAGELPSETFPATTGAVGGYVKVAPVRVLAATIAATVVAGGVYALWWLLGPAGPLVVPVPVP